MALISCRECNGSVSTEAVTCPHCGAPQQRPVPPPFPVQPKEEKIYCDNAVAVTTTRVIVGGTTHTNAPAPIGVYLIGGAIVRSKKSLSSIVRRHRALRNSMAENYQRQNILRGFRQMGSEVERAVLRWALTRNQARTDSIGLFGFSPRSASHSSLKNLD